MNAVIFPEGALCPVVAGMGAQLADNGALRGLFHCQGHEDPSALVPFPDDVILPNLPDGLQDRIAVAARVIESGQGRADFIAEILVSRGKLVAEHIQQREIHFIGAMGVRGMNLGLDIRAVVEENVEDEVALMVVRTNVIGVDRNIVGDRRIGHDPLLQPKIFG